MSVYQISLADCLNPGTSPPSQVLTLAVIDDTVFLQIDKLSGSGDTETHKTKVEITVSLPSLRQALELLADDSAREAARPLDPPDNEHGDRGTRIAGARYTVTPI